MAVEAVSLHGSRSIRRRRDGQVVENDKVDAEAEQALLQQLDAVLSAFDASQNHTVISPPPALSPALATLSAVQTSQCTATPSRRAWQQVGDLGQSRAFRASELQKPRADVPRDPETYDQTPDATT